jgi:hypothetical protein
MLTKPSQAKVKEWSTSVFWFDEDGILCGVSRKGPQQSLEEAKQTIKEFKEFVGHEKVCMLMDVSHTAESTRELRDYAAVELPQIIKALAMVSDSALGTMLANLFFAVKSQPYPVKMFKNEAEARTWLKQYM